MKKIILSLSFLAFATFLFGKNASTTSIFGDVNGDGIADFQNNLTEALTLAATNFIL